MQETVSVFSAFTLNDVWYLGEAALRTLYISAVSIALGTLLGGVFGWMLYEGKPWSTFSLAPLLDVFRSVPLIIQLVLFYNAAPIMGLNLDPFGSGVVILTLYTSALVMTYWQDLRYIVLPIGGRAVFPSWVGVALGVMKDSALVSVLGYVELLKASENLTTRTQEPFIILAVAGAFYFALSFPLSRYAASLERRWAQ